MVLLLHKGYSTAPPNPGSAMDRNHKQAFMLTGSKKVPFQSYTQQIEGLNIVFEFLIAFELLLQSLIIIKG